MLDESAGRRARKNAGQIHWEISSEIRFYG
jgi:hypothetical protein